MASSAQHGNTVEEQPENMGPLAGGQSRPPLGFSLGLPMVSRIMALVLKVT